MNKPNYIMWPVSADGGHISVNAHKNECQIHPYITYTIYLNGKNITPYQTTNMISENNWYKVQLLKFVSQEDVIRIGNAQKELLERLNDKADGNKLVESIKAAIVAGEDSIEKYKKSIIRVQEIVDQLKMSLLKE